MGFIPDLEPGSWVQSTILITLAALGSGSQAQESVGSGQTDVLLSRDRVELPTFQEISKRPLIHLYANEDDYNRARLDGSYEYERLTYLSDGLEVVAYLYRPQGRVDPQPTIVFNRGSYVRNDSAPEYLTMFHRLAESGYSLLAPMYRGSEGAEGQDEMGGADLNDLMQVAALADELPSVDAHRLFLLGESRGGMMVLQAIRDGFPAHAAAIYGSPTDFYRLFDEYPDQYEGIADQIWPHWRTETEEILGRRSAVEWADGLHVPILIMHGGLDQSMPVTQSLLLADRLEEFNRTYELYIFGYENHAISGRAKERDALAIAWYEKHSAN
jgi:dipeptidyl aminopeptidase/acylaminoacyl peptidase